MNNLQQLRNLKKKNRKIMSVQIKKKKLKIFDKKKETWRKVSDFYHITLYKYLSCKYKIQIRHIHFQDIIIIKLLILFHMICKFIQ